MLGLGPGRLRGIAVGELPGRMNDAALYQALQALLAQLVPAGIEAALVLGDILLMGMQRPVRRRVRDILEERRPGVVLLVRADEVRRLIADRIGVEEFRILLGLVLDVLVAARQRVGMIEASRPDDGAEELVEAALQRPGIRRFREIAGDVPLAAQIAPVVLALEHFGDGHAVAIQVAGIALRPGAVGENADPGLMRVEAGQKRGARGRAAGRIVELRIAQAVLG